MKYMRFVDPTAVPFAHPLTETAPDSLPSVRVCVGVFVWRGAF